MGRILILANVSTVECPYSNLQRYCIWGSVWYSRYGLRSLVPFAFAEVITHRLEHEYRGFIQPQCPIVPRRIPRKRFQTKHGRCDILSIMAWRS